MHNSDASAAQAHAADGIGDHLDLDLDLDLRLLQALVCIAGERIGTAFHEHCHAWGEVPHEDGFGNGAGAAGVDANRAPDGLVGVVHSAVPQGT